MTLVLLALLTGVACADDDVRARELYENGVILYDEGRYSDAVVAWQEAYRLSNRPVLLFNIANALERDGQYGPALETLNRYRSYAKADERETLDRRIRNLERRILELPMPVPLPMTTTGPDLVGTAPPVAPETDALPWIMLGGGAVLIGNGVFFGTRAVGAREEATGLCVDGTDDVLCLSSASAALKRDRVSSIVADASFLVGTGLATGGVVLMVRAGSATSAVVGLKGRF